jgi:hypothetical protein
VVLQWEAEQDRIAERYSSAVELVARIENRETVANSEVDLTEDKWVEHNKETSSLGRALGGSMRKC